MLRLRRPSARIIATSAEKDARRMNNPGIVWSIAGSDPSGGAGIQADLKTFAALDVYGCAVITAVIAQNSRGVNRVAPVAPDLVAEQLKALADDVPPAAVKIGLIPSRAIARTVADVLRALRVPVVFDPVAIAGTGHALAVEDVIPAMKEHLLPVTTILTPNILEAEGLAGRPVASYDAMPAAAQALCEMGPRAVLIKGGHLPETDACDLWYDGNAVWLRNSRRTGVAFHGSGCTLSSALTAALAHGLAPLDAAVVAKAYISQGIRLAPAVGQWRRPLCHGPWPSEPQDLPHIISEPGAAASTPFPRCESGSLGFYLIVSRAVDIERFALAGVRTMQLRAKDLRGEALSREVALAIQTARRFSIRLFINDAADEALRHGAFGVHLGQEDLPGQDLEAVRSAGLRLGVSVYTWSDLARAAALQPTYVGIGAVFATGTKDVKHPPLELAGLRKLAAMAPAPAVAIGGITLERARDVFNTGVEGIAVISDVHSAPDPIARAREWRKTWDQLWSARQALRGAAAKNP
jgi:hydroxymethylpyrimidine kinase/phosphomethylpyrimidine kinase/thiamine-phosphate diphosphorylase